MGRLCGRVDDESRWLCLMFEARRNRCRAKRVRISKVLNSKFENERISVMLKEKRTDAAASC